MLKTVSCHIYFHSSTQKHLGPGLTSPRDWSANLEQVKTMYGSPETTQHVAMWPTRGGRCCGHQPREERGWGQATGRPRLPQSVSLTISSMPLMPIAAEFHFPSAFLARPLGKARWWGSRTVIHNDAPKPHRAGCREQKSATA